MRPPPELRRNPLAFRDSGGRQAEQGEEVKRHGHSGIDIDVTFGGLSFERAAIDQSIIHDISGLAVRLPRVEDLLVMKAVARRPKDLQDIDGLLAANPQADLVAVRQWVSEFATALSVSDMLDEFDKLVARSKSKP